MRQNLRQKAMKALKNEENLKVIILIISIGKIMAGISSPLQNIFNLLIINLLM